MPQPIAICLEEVLAAGSDGGARGGGATANDGQALARPLRCVAVPGTGPGLGLDGEGRVVWRGEPAAPAVELWVSADDRLILRRREGAPAVRVSRGGRSVEAPAGKPVVLLDGDEVAVGDARRLRVHVHGRTGRVRAPAPLEGGRSMTGAGRLAAAAALGAALVGCDGPIEVRPNPPDMPVDPDAMPPDAGPPDGPWPPDAPAPVDALPSDGAPPDVAPPDTVPPPDVIEIRDQPPAPPPPDDAGVDGGEPDGGGGS